MSQGTKTSPMVILLAAVVAAVLIVGGVNFVTTKLGDDGQSFVDIEADWTAGREMDILWRVGPHSDEVYVGPDERPHFGIRRVAQRGWVVGVTVAPRDGSGTISCSISIDEQQQIDDQVDGDAPCDIDVTV